MSSRYPITIHISQEMSDKIDTPVDPAVISNRPGGGNTVQSFLKGDIIADQLNAVFGPLGWGVEARIHQMDDWDETKTVTRNNAPKDIAMHMVQVVSDVKLTIKKTTPEGSDTIFVQPGIGYGEAEEGKSRKEAFGMAVKGAATDGLKRCATLVGKAFGMMMASNGSQEDIEYAHNGKQQNLRKAQDMRRSQGGGRQQDQRPQAEGRGQAGRQQESRTQEPRQNADDRGRDDRGAGRGDEQRGQATPRGDRQPQDDRGRGQERTREDERPREQERPRQDRPAEGGRDERGGEQRRPDPDAGRSEAGSRAPERVAEPEAAKPAAEKEPAKAPAAKRGADTNYALDSLPITRQDMTDFGATLLERVRELKQHSDRVGLVRQHLNTIKNLDSPIRKRVIDRLRELEVDVDKVPS
jgi:hypothetical protein